jgi:hypothetical protein
MRFRCHLLVAGQFFEAGTEIPPEVPVPGAAMRYVIPDASCGTAVPEVSRETMVSPAALPLEGRRARVGCSKEGGGSEFMRLRP